jgi:hypothetical protein
MISEEPLTERNKLSVMAPILSFEPNRSREMPKVARVHSKPIRLKAFIATSPQLFAVQ